MECWKFKKEYIYYMKYFKSSVKIKKKDLFFLFAIPLLPLIGYLYLLVEPGIQKLTIFNFNINNTTYIDISTWFWTIGIKVVMFLTLAFWFVSCKHWWRYSILIPLIFTTNQLIFVINEELAIFDNNDFFLSLIISMPIILFLFYISRKLNYYSKAKTFDDELDSEINNLMDELFDFKSENYKIAKQQFDQIKSQKAALNKKEYLKKLVTLRDEYINIS
ncbi:hypothetical protein [Bizionia sp.]|uniref:hypothetical protein n=1 Tax=Bizionia sp. TaxID=1954480 RepID=UPI003A9547A8